MHHRVVVYVDASAEGNMNKRLLLCIALMLAGCQTVPTMSGERFDVMAFARVWADAYNACDVDALNKLYHPKAHVWFVTPPTLSATPEAVRAALRAPCAPSEPRRSIAISPTSVQEFGDTVVGAGTAQVSLTRPDGQLVRIPVNYTVTYLREAGRWSIIQHHASLPPPPPPAR